MENSSMNLDEPIEGIEEQLKSEIKQEDINEIK